MTYKKILMQSGKPWRKRIYNAVKYWRLRQGSAQSWKQRYARVRALNPRLFDGIDASIEREHRAYWGRFRRIINLDTLRVSAHLSNRIGMVVIPEEIFVSDIEPTLNRYELAKFIEIKNVYNHWFGDAANFPKIYLNKMGNVYYDGHFQVLSPRTVEGIWRGLDLNRVVIKPSSGSYGGKHVILSPSIDEIMNAFQTLSDVVLQDRVQLDPQYASIAGGKPVSTRVYMYKSVTDDSWHYLNSVLRMALGTSLDNETSGGIVTGVSITGKMNGYAVDKNGTKHYQHPETSRPFDAVVADYGGLVDKATALCERIPFARIVGLDFLFDHHQEWRPIELNLFGATIRFAQYHGTSFFGPYTDEVIEYCEKNHWVYD